MKSLVRLTLVTAITIGLIAAFIPGLSYRSDIQVLIVAAGVLTLANVILKPVLKIILLPITVVTLGLFGWLANVVVLYITTLVVDGFAITPFELAFQGRTFIFSTFLAYVIISFLLNVVSRCIGWVLGR